ncbi:MAG TPA: hypothetical protein VD837_14795 [Terriglobales bacterium]|nr:hypothetical protein [Terriglobales bacterium]
MWSQNAPQAQQPGVRVNYLNVCSPTEAEQREIAAALALVPLKPAFALDFEVARGRSTMPEQSAESPNTVITSAPVSSWVRIRHEFSPRSALSNAQYSFSFDEKGITETLALRVRDAAKNNNVLQISVQDSVRAGTPESVLASDTPVGRVRIERSGTASLVLARCSGTDQSAYEPIFRTASEIMAKYRRALRVRGTVQGDLARLRTATTQPNGRSRSSKADQIKKR